MKLSVLSIQNKLFENEVKSITVSTTSGEITILDNHIPLISVIKSGPIVYLGIDNKKGYIDISSGILEIQSENKTVILVQ